MINELAQQVYENAKQKGFYEQDRIQPLGVKLCLIHGEVSEALEADRNDSYMDPTISMQGVLGWTGDTDFEKSYKKHVKGTFEEEMADIILRVLDICADKGIDIESHLKAKMRYNTTREKYHGKKY